MDLGQSGSRGGVYRGVRDNTGRPAAHGGRPQVMLNEIADGENEAV